MERDPMEGAEKELKTKEGFEGAATYVEKGHRPDAGADIGNGVFLDKIEHELEDGKKIRQYFYDIRTDSGNESPWTVRADLQIDSNGRGNADYLGVKRDNKIVLPPEVAAVLLIGQTIKNVPEDQLEKILEEGETAYARAVEADQKEIEDAGGLEKYIEEKAKKMKKEWFWIKDKDHAKWYIRTQWEKCGPQNARDETDFINKRLTAQNPEFRSVIGKDIITQSHGINVYDNPELSYLEPVDRYLPE